MGRGDDTYSQGEFDRSLGRLRQALEELPSPLTSAKDIPQRLQPRRVTALLDAAQGFVRQGDPDSGWVRLVDAAEMLGKIEGWEAVYRYPPTKQVVQEAMSKNGRKGGRTKGANSHAVREKVVRALVKEAPNDGWPTVVKFEMAYHLVVQDIPDFRATEYSYRAIRRNPEIKKRLRSSIEAIRDVVVDRMLEMEPRGGWASYEEFLECLDVVAQSMPKFKCTRKQVEMIKKHPKIKEKVPRDEDGWRIVSD